MAFDGIDDPNFAVFNFFLTTPPSPNPAPPSNPFASFASSGFQIFANMTTSESNPSSHRSSFSSTLSKEASERVVIEEISRTSTPDSKVTTSSTTIVQKKYYHATDPLLRNYPKPAEVVSTTELMARPALRHSLSNWAKNARDLQQLVKDPETRAKEREATMRELREAQMVFTRK